MYGRRPIPPQVGAQQRLALSTTLHRLVQAGLHNRRLFLPADWRPKEWLISRIARSMPGRCEEGVVSRHRSTGSGLFVWHAMQLRRVERVGLYMKKQLKDESRYTPHTPLCPLCLLAAWPWSG